MINSSEVCSVSPVSALTDEAIKMREMANAVRSNTELLYCHMFGELKNNKTDNNESPSCFSDEIHATMLALNQAIELQNMYMERMGVSR